MSEDSKNYKSYRTSAILFLISGIVFICLSIIPDRIAIFLPIGIALLIIGMGIWQKSRKIKENEQGNSSEVNQ
jgi:membrane-bound ClpP family serine protease